MQKSCGIQASPSRISFQVSLLSHSEEKVNFDRVRVFFSIFILKLNVVLSFPALSLGFPVFKTYFIFDVNSKS